MRAIILVALLLVGCREQEPPAPTSEQSDQLNEAEAMLNEMGKEEGPEDRSPGPSNSSD
jgi:PBP1b-binding outer membrane lipoprotein LpoB